MIFREMPPSAGLPIYAKDLLGLFKSDMRKDHLAEDFRKYLDVPYARVTYSGTAGLYFILEGLKGLSDKRTVIIPSYICPLVPLAIARAGYRVEVCDINKDNLGFDIAGLEEICAKDDDIAALLATHLAGMPIDFDGVKRIADKHGIFIIEDCAQALGASYKGRHVGTLGDFSFFSLCRGKGLTIYEGGAVVTKTNEYAGMVEAVINSKEKKDHLSEAVKILELLGYWIFYRPLFCWFIYKFPEFFWNRIGNRYKAEREYFGMDFQTHKVSAIRKEVGHIVFARLEDEIAGQRDKASYYIKELQGIEGLKIIEENTGDRSNYPYLMLIYDNPDKRNEVLKAVSDSGLGISWSYSQPITGYPYLKTIVGNKDHPNGRYIAEREITLSTSNFLKEGDLRSVVKAIRDLA